MGGTRPQLNGKNPLGSFWRCPYHLFGFCSDCKPQPTKPRTPPAQYSTTTTITVHIINNQPQHHHDEHIIIVLIIIITICWPAGALLRLFAIRTPPPAYSKTTTITIFWGLKSLIEIRFIVNKLVYYCLQCAPCCLKEYLALEFFFEMLYQIIRVCQKYLNSTFVPSQNGSGPEHFSTDIAWEGHSFQMIGFYVVSDSDSLTFFSAHFANFCKFVRFAAWVFHLLVCH